MQNLRGGLAGMPGARCSGRTGGYDGGMKTRVESLINDFRFAGRSLGKNAGFTCIVVLTLALGIGAVSSVFSLIDGVLLTPPPYSNPNQIVLIKLTTADGRPSLEGCAGLQWAQWEKEAGSFEAMAGYHWEFDFLCLPDTTEQVNGLVTTPSYFQVVGVQPRLGRAFLASEGYKDPVVIIGNDLWRRLFNSDRHIIGKTIHLSRSDALDIGPRTIVGVMPAGVRFLPSPAQAEYPGYDVNKPIDYWLPAHVDLSNGKHDYYNVVGRLRDHITPAQAQAELGVITGRQSHADKEFEGLTARVEPLQNELNREGSRLLFPLFGAVAMVFLIACGNVAGLVLARGLQRQQEYAIRCALGASRLQIFRQVFVENLLLAFFGGAVAVGFAGATVKGLKVFAGTALPRLDAVRTGWPSLCFCITASAAAAVLVGLVPALRAVQLEPAKGIKGRTSSPGRADRQLLSGLAVLQTALTLALLVGAGLLIRTVMNLGQVRPGYETQNILSMSVTQVRYVQQAAGMKEDKAWVSRFLDFHRRAVSQIARLPGIKSAAWAWGVPLTGNKWVGTINVSHLTTIARSQKDVGISMRSVTPEYFQTVGLPLVEGRGFRAKEAFEWPWPSSATNVAFAAIVNQAMAERYFSGMDPIGKSLRFSFENIHGDAKIVGIVANAHDEALTQRSEPELYFSFWQLPPGTKHLVVRTVSDPALLTRAVQRELRRLDPTVVIQEVKTFARIRKESISSQLFAMRLLTAFSFLAGAVALIGIYGVLSLSVACRRREMAVRIAVGAQRANVLVLVLGQGSKLVGLGVAIGMAGALVMTGLLKAFLFGVTPSDPLTFGVTAILFTVVALVACLIPARRATKVDPIMALRYE